MGKYHKAKDGLPVYANFDSVIDGDGQTLRDVVIQLKQMIINSQGGEGYDVVIVGSGSAGIAAAYALKNAPYKVCVVEKLDKIGGTAINAWMNCFAASGDVPFLKKITKDLIVENKALYVDTRYQVFANQVLANVVYDDTIVEQRFIQNGRTEACVSYDPDALRDRYLQDLGGMKIITSAELVAAIKTGDAIESITISRNGEQEVIKGKIFIDCTGDDVLLRVVNNPTYIGSDAKTRYQSEYGFVENNAGNTSIATALNYPSLIYRVELGEEDLSGITAAYSRDILPYYNPDKTYIYLNPLATLASNDATGASVVADGVDIVYNRLFPRTKQQWKNIKENGGVKQAVLNSYNFSAQKYSTQASMLGVRETYRAKCERMLNENSFYVQVSSDNIATGDNLDKKIAYGNHIADSHGDSSINVAAINANLVPYGVPYGSIVPVGLTNTFVASRGAGMTHIGACSFRLNKDVMQLGYAAGKAAQIYLEQGLTDTRNVDVELLQSAKYTDFVGLVERLEAYID